MTVPGGEGDRIRATIAILGGQGDGEESSQDDVETEEHCKTKEQTHIGYSLLCSDIFRGEPLELNQRTGFMLIKC
jgi:hypothetical protein